MYRYLTPTPGGNPDLEIPTDYIVYTAMSSFPIGRVRLAHGRWWAERNGGRTLDLLGDEPTAEGLALSAARVYRHYEMVLEARTGAIDKAIRAAMATLPDLDLFDDDDDDLGLI